MDDWLKASIDRQKKQQSKRARTRIWNRKLKGSVEFVISSLEKFWSPEGEAETSILPRAGDFKVGVEGKRHVTGAPQTDRSCIPEHSAAYEESSQETLILQNRRISGSSNLATD